MEDMAQNAVVKYTQFMSLLIFMRDNTSVIREADEGKSNYTWHMFLVSVNNSCYRIFIVIDRTYHLCLLQ